MQRVELAPDSVEAIARRVAELLGLERTPTVPVQPVALLPIAAPPPTERESRGRRREDLTGGLQGTPFRRPS
jgi:hypothetical protein